MSPQTANPPLGVPSTIQFRQIDPDTFAQADGGGLLPSASLPDSVVVRIAGDTSGVFSVRTVETLHLVRDPDAPQAGLSWQTLATVEGAGPISLKGARAIDVTVGFASKPNPDHTSFQATALIVSGDAPSDILMTIPIEATVNPAGRLTVVELASAPLTNGFASGQTAMISFRFTSTLDHAVAGSFRCVPAPGLPASSPVIPVTVPSDQIVDVKLPVTVAAATAPGRFNAVFEFVSNDTATHASIALQLLVLSGRTISVTPSLPQNLPLEPNSSTTCVLTVEDSGGFSEIAVSAGTLPSGVSISVGPTRVISQGPAPGTGQTLELDVTINVAPQKPTGGKPSPLVMHWVVPPDGSHPEVAGDVIFNCKVAQVSDVASKIKDFHRRTGADFGPLGVPVGGVTMDAGGGFQQEFLLGNVRVEDDVTGSPVGQTKTYEAVVTLAAVRCFGTQDADGSDSPYLVISLFTLNPNDSGSDQFVSVAHTEIIDNVHAGNTVFDDGRTLGKLPPGGSGICIHVALWDHESGNADDITKQIQSVIEDGVKKGAAALASAAAADDPSVSGGTIGNIFDFEVGGVKPFHFLTLGIARLISNAVADDLVGEQSFPIPASNIVDLADSAKFAASIRRDPDLPFDVQLNWPPSFDDEKDKIFTDGHGTYKVYFLIRTDTIIHAPLTPSLP